MHAFLLSFVPPLSSPRHSPVLSPPMTLTCASQRPSQTWGVYFVNIAGGQVVEGIGVGVMEVEWSGGSWELGIVRMERTGRLVGNLWDLEDRV